MKRFNKLLCFMLVFITVMIAFCTVSFAATVGDQLTAPEAGWKRYDETCGAIATYGGGWVSKQVFTGRYGGTASVSSSNGAQAIFKFKGTNIRIIGEGYYTHSNSINVNIDGIDMGDYSIYTPKPNRVLQLLAFEKLGLDDSIHTVKLTNSSGWIVIDAIDLNDTGYMIGINQPTNLYAAAGNMKVSLSWDAVEGATSYNVKRSLTPGGPYETITTTSAITFTDTIVTNGTTYYYVVTSIVNGVESDPSNEASATPTAPTDPEPSGNSAILEITMVTGEIKEYDLTAAELRSFLSWYDGRSNGADKAYYMIPKKNNIKPFLSRKDYIAFDKISSFEVKEYTD